MKKCDVCVYVLSVIKVVVFFLCSSYQGYWICLLLKKNTISAINYIMTLLAICVRPFMLG